MTREAGTPWRPPTRRAFVAMLGLAAAALAIPKTSSARRERDARPRETQASARTTRWIGHC